MIKIITFKFIKRLRTDDFMGYAAQISFYLLVSLIPLLIMMTALLGGSRIVELEMLLEILGDTHIFPASTLTMIDTMFQGVTLPTQSIPIYVILVIWFASRGIRAIMNAIHMTFRTRNSFSIPRHFLLSFFYTICFVLMIVLFVILIIFGDRLFTFLYQTFQKQIFISMIVRLIRYVIPLLFLLVFYTVLYRVIPGKELRIQDVLPGSIGATIGSYVVSLVFSLFVSRSTTNYSAIYGGLASIAILCTWMWLFALVLILGSELNACIYEVKNDTTLISIY
ncbi:MAG: YihY/virulence factor BrkB family protein [Firmicutes bacterium]|nr:YihY/virulence factor BrkB family protein [Bacillota bacterium]